jgi:hypothetical protein
MAPHYFPFIGTDAFRPVCAGDAAIFRSQPIADNNAAKGAAWVFAKVTVAVLR